MSDDTAAAEGVTTAMPTELVRAGADAWSECAEVAEGPQRRRWVVPVAAVAVSAVALLGVSGFYLFHGQTRAPTPRLRSVPTSQPKSDVASRLPALDGVYRLVYEESAATQGVVGMTLQEAPTYWAFISPCKPTCMLYAVPLQDDGETQRGAALTLNYEGGALWDSIVTGYDLALDSCPDATLRADISFDNVPDRTARPDLDRMSGTTEISVTNDACGLVGTKFQVPTTAIRIGDAPKDLDTSGY